MSKLPWILLGAGAVGVGIALASQSDTGQAAVKEVSKGVKEVRRGARKVAQRMSEALGGGITQDQVDRIQQYNIAALVQQYMGRVPFGVAMAMCEHESNFRPLRYNYYPVENGVKNTNKLGQADARPGAPLVTKWAQAWDGGCEFDPHACGVLQILDDIRNKQNGSYGGVKLPYLNDLFDAEKNIHAALAGRDSDASSILAIVPSASGALLAALIYMAHAEGLGKLTGGKFPGAFAKLKAAGQEVTWANIAALPWGAAGWWKLGNRLSGIAKTAARAAVWEEAKARLLAGAGAAAVGAEPDTLPPPDPVEALLMAAQAAEIERDLPLAADLRAKLDLLTGAA